MGQPALFLQSMVRPRQQFRDGVACKELRRATSAGDLPGRRLGTLLAKFEWIRLRRLRPGAAYAGKSIGLILMEEDARAADRRATAHQASADRLHRAPAACWVRVSRKFRIMLHCEFQIC